MIKKIKKLKNLGIFKDFNWGSETNDFKKFNLIYGWNRSGKTSISRIFASCEKKCTYDENKFKQYPKHGEFEIKTDSVSIKDTDVINNILPIKVFNQDFIDENISFDDSNLCNPIIYVSDKDIQSKRQLEKLKLDSDDFSKKHILAEKEILIQQKIKDNFLVPLAKNIKDDLNLNYTKTTVENLIKQIGIDNFDGKFLSDENERNYTNIINNEPKNEQHKLSDYQINFSFNSKIIDNFQKIFEEVKNLLNKNVISESLDRLKNDQDLNTWVKHGFDLHKTKEETKKCLFCEKPLDKDFLDTLSRHFSEDYEKLQNQINDLKNGILRFKEQEVEVENKDLYPNLKSGYKNNAENLNKCIRKMNEWIDKTVEILEEKYNKPLDVVNSPDTPQDFLNSYNSSIAKLNAIIEEHNEKTKNHTQEVEKAKEQLVMHMIAKALSEEDLKKMNNDLEQAINNENTIKTNLDKINPDIQKLENQSSDIGVAIADVNKHLKEFFGEEEITLELAKENKGYSIKRNGEIAENLSEGEKSAIAFSYFIVKVGEKEFDKSNGIIFIDDPISSFDSNFIYHCFSIIRTHFSEVGQLFISTHNFQFFNLIKNWFIRNNKNRKKGNKDECCEFFMVENFIESNTRKARIVALDKTLREYKSEYHFLFYNLKKFVEREDIQYEDFYTIGNMARRFFDIFADFKRPTIEDQKTKLEELVKDINDPEEKISIAEKTKAYKLINDFSHNSDPASAIEHKDKSEIKDAIKILLSIVKESDPKHFELLKIKSI
ncbi:MAG: AAA family ATPase [Candidatus Campbellbacteria bacterium]|nr:AAA family ATPase [Candidatus Campbellbacteria bacterium]